MAYEERQRAQGGEGDKMRKLSIGLDATLENYRKMSVLVFGEDSAAVKFIDKKIVASPNGAKEEVLADESQMIYTLFSLEEGK